MRSLSAMAGAVNKLCEDLLIGSHAPGVRVGQLWHPPTDVFECDKVYVIKMAVSGLSRAADGKVQGAEVWVEDDTVIVRGNRADLCPHTKRAFFQMEIHYGCFERRVRINAPFDRERIRAEYRDGFLEVIVPKAQRARSGTRRIEVRSRTRRQGSGQAS